MSDYGLRAWISMKCGSPPRNVFIILCNDSLDNNSFSSEGISIKMEESIKRLYARIYKLGNFLDYCNHLQNWLFQCGIDRFQQLSLTTSTFAGIYSYWSLNQVTVPPRASPVVFGLKVRQTFREPWKLGSFGCLPRRRGFFERFVALLAQVEFSLWKKALMIPMCFRSAQILKWCQLKRRSFWPIAAINICLIDDLKVNNLFYLLVLWVLIIQQIYCRVPGF